MTCSCTSPWNIKTIKSLPVVSRHIMKTSDKVRCKVSLSNLEETQIQLHERQILSNFVIEVFPKNPSVHRQATIHKLLFVLLSYLWSTVDFTSSTREELRLSLLFAGHHHCMVLGDCGILSVLKQLRDMIRGKLIIWFCYCLVCFKQTRSEIQTQIRQEIS